MCPFSGWEECMAQIIGVAVVSCPEVRSLFKLVAHAGLSVRARVGVCFGYY